MSRPLAIPTDIIEEIVDNVQLFDDVKSLRNLTLTSPLFLPRSRYHLFSWHIRINSVRMLNSFCDFLDTHPDRRLLVRWVTVVATRESLSLSEVVPVRLLTNLPNWYQWRITDSTSLSRSISSNTPKLLCLRYYAKSITHLHLDNVSFQSCADFVRYILAFPGLRHLHCASLGFEHTDDGMALVRARDRLSKDSSISHLTINGLPKIAVPLLLESTQHALQELVIEVGHYSGNESVVKLPTLIPLLSRVSSITLQAWFTGREDTSGIIQHVVNIIQALPSNPHSSITHVAVHVLDRDISKLLEYLQNHSNDLLQMCCEIESALLRLPQLQRIELCHHLRRPSLRSWTSVRLEQYLSTLYKQRLTDVTCLAPPTQCHSDRVTALAVSPNGRWIASGSADTTIILWDAQRGTVVHEWPVHSRTIKLLAFSQDSRYLASSDYDGGVIVWDVDEGVKAKLVTVLEGADLCVGSDDGMMITLTARNGTVHIWNPSTDRVQLHSLEGYPEDTLLKPILSPDGRWIALYGTGDSWKIWDARTGRLHRVLPGTVRRDYLNEPAFDPAGQRIVIPWDEGLGHSVARIWDVETGDELAVLESTALVSHCIMFSPDGIRVVAASDDGAMTLWDSSSDKTLLSFHGHEDAVTKVCFSPDGKYLASASDDHTVRLWNASDGSCIRTFTEHDMEVECVAFTPDGETLTSGGDDGLVCIRRLHDVCPEYSRET